MRILIVAFANSIHTARWVSQLVGQGWDIHVFSSTDGVPVRPEMRGVVVHRSVYFRQRELDASVRLTGIPVGSPLAASGAIKLLERSRPDYRARQLAGLIDRLKPDVVHSLEIQHAGYLTLDALRLVRHASPKWIVTNWGNDIYLFGRLAAHKERIREVLNRCDYYSSECQRDVDLAREFGFTGTILPVSPNTGGFDLEELQSLRLPGPTSRRRLIMVKGYEGWAGRAFVALRALARCADLLSGYEIRVYNASEDVAIAAELLADSARVRVTLVPAGTEHQEMLRLHGQARVSLGLNISDGVSTSFLEALAMGSFPIQSWTSSADEWIENGATGLLVPPEDPEIVEQALRQSLTDDQLVDNAASANWQTVCTRLDKRILDAKAVAFYETVVRGPGKGDS
jgi:glycosyltransferase involved in cell wall biosynthesis